MQHLDNPFADNATKQQLAQASGKTAEAVSNCLIGCRARWMGHHAPPGYQYLPGAAGAWADPESSDDSDDGGS